MLVLSRKSGNPCGGRRAAEIAQSRSRDQSGQVRLGFEPMTMFRPSFGVWNRSGGLRQYPDGQCASGVILSSKRVSDSMEGPCV